MDYYILCLTPHEGKAMCHCIQIGSNVIKIKKKLKINFKIKIDKHSVCMCKSITDSFLEISANL